MNYLFGGCQQGRFNILLATGTGLESTFSFTPVVGLYAHSPRQWYASAIPLPVGYPLQSLTQIHFIVQRLISPS